MRDNNLENKFRTLKELYKSLIFSINFKILGNLLRILRRKQETLNLIIQQSLCFLNY